MGTNFYLHLGKASNKQFLWAIPPAVIELLIGVGTVRDEDGTNMSVEEFMHRSKGMMGGSDFSTIGKEFS